MNDAMYFGLYAAYRAHQTAFRNGLSAEDFSYLRTRLIAKLSRRHNHRQPPPMLYRVTAENNVITIQRKQLVYRNRRLSIRKLPDVSGKVNITTKTEMAGAFYT